METLQYSHTHSVFMQQSTPSAEGAETVRLAYLMSRYPAVSHTFLLKEVLGLRARGLQIETASINIPDRSAADLPSDEALEAKSTFYMKRTAPSDVFRQALTTALTRPDVVLRGLSTIARVRSMTLRERGYWLFYLAEALVLGRWMQEQDLHHLHVHFGGPVASVGLLTSIAWQIPYSLTIHGPEELLHPAAHRLREKLDRASFVFCISDFCRSQLCALTEPSSWDKFRVVRLGVDPCFLNPSLRSPAAVKHDPRQPLELLCVGRLVPEKGHAVLLQALAALYQRGIRINATLVGSGPERERLEHFAHQNLPPEAVVFTSALSHPETLQILRKADLFALTSFAEGIPVALMEAMALGIPCVSTSTAGIPELIRSGQDGLLVPPGDVRAATDALASLVADPDLRRRLGSSARQRILTDYNLPLNQEALAHSFAELVHAGCRVATFPRPRRATHVPTGAV